MKSSSESGAIARRFHEGTKHSPESVWESGHRLDWRNKPYPFKVYEDGDAVDLPRPFPELEGAALGALETVVRHPKSRGPDLTGLARILGFGAGVLRRVTYGDESFHFRTYASAGALYPIEIYVVSEAINGLEAGVYHFDPLGFRLIRLRAGHHRGVLADALADETGSSPPVSFILTGIPWRTAWKYTERGYRHLFWDAGMILANIFALASSAGWPTRVVLGFADRDLSGLLGIDGKREFPLCVVSLGPESVAPVGNAVAPITLDTRPLSRREVELEVIEGVNEAGVLRSRDEVRAWRARLADAVRARPSETRPASGQTEPASVGRARPEDSLEKVIRRRGSARFFRRGSMPLEALRRTLHAAMRPILSDYAPAGAVLVEPYLIANAVEGLAPGAYVYRDGDFVLLREGNFRREAGHLCLEQRLGADAAATIFLMADLDLVLAAAGDRGYRVAQLEGGIVGGRIYLGAYAHRFGATGLTFYDDLVTEFFSPDAAGKSCMLVVAVGESPRLSRSRGQPPGRGTT
ncbi:MAG TPA: SagB/ThcOx family dehydrogenase [Actinomycetota bacterium]|nr:SagB/ThcOx family dehydrogenase [Actinomycetota bacterium]